MQNHVWNLALEWQKQGHKVQILAPLGNKKAIYPIESQKEIVFCDLGTPRRIRWMGTTIDIGWISKSTRNRIRNEWTISPPDLIHIHTPWNPFIPIQLRGIIPAVTRRLVSFHDTPAENSLGSFFLPLLYRFFSPYFNRKISVSATQAKALGLNPQFMPEHHQILPNGIPDKLLDLPFESFFPKKSRLNLLFLGRLEERKAPITVLRLLDHYQQQPHCINCHLQIIGNGPLKAEVDAYLEAKPTLKKRVQWQEEVSESDKYEAIQQADMLIVPSLFGESFGIILLEAMALGTPVLGYGNAGYRELAAAYAPEMFPNPHDDKALYEAFMQLINKAEKGEELQKIGRELAENYRWSVLAEKILNYAISN